MDDNPEILACKLCNYSPIVFKSEHSKKWTIHCVKNGCKSTFAALDEYKANAIFKWNIHK